MSCCKPSAPAGCCPPTGSSPCCAPKPQGCCSTAACPPTAPSCCGPSTACCPGQQACCPATAGGGGESKAPPEAGKTTDFVKEYYGKVLTKTKDLKTSACTPAMRPPPYVKEALRAVPEEILSRFYGCGSPIPAEIEGLTVLDLGCGTGRDCYIAARFTGSKGRVIGIDMTEEQLAVAQKHAEEYCRGLGYPACVLDFRKGFIESIASAGVAPGTVDLVMSNCVVNLSPDKEAVIKGAAQALKEGGELYFSDVYCDRRLPASVQQHEVLWGECISGALYAEDFKRIARKAGFTDPRMLHQTEIRISDPGLQQVVGEARFYSILFRCFKFADLEESQEDYGQVAIYKGGIVGSPSAYAFDEQHYFVKGKPMLVSGNTASMLSKSRLASYFIVNGDRSVHYGAFRSGTTSAPPPVATPASSCGSSCC